jgi:hypothetical protein
MAEAETVENEEVTEQPKEEKKEQPKFSREDYEKLQVEKARKDGWTDFDEWQAAGKDPASWRSAEAFNQFLSFKGTLTRKEQEFAQRLEGVQRLTQAQLEAQRVQLTRERDELIEQGGKSKEVKALDKQIDALVIPPQPQTSAALDEWNAENPWINEDSPKSVYAKDLYVRQIHQGKSVEQAIAAVEAGLKKHYPPPSAKTTTIPESERGSGSRGFGKSTKALTMADLNDEEKLAWKHMSHAWKNEKEFLQAAQDLRNAAKGAK